MRDIIVVALHQPDFVQKAVRRIIDASPNAIVRKVDPTLKSAGLDAVNSLLATLEKAFNDALLESTSKEAPFEIENKPKVKIIMDFNFGFSGKDKCSYLAVAKLMEKYKDHFEFEPPIFLGSGGALESKILDEKEKDKIALLNLGEAKSEFKAYGIEGLTPRRGLTPNKTRKRKFSTPLREEANHDSSVVTLPPISVTDSSRLREEEKKAEEQKVETKKPRIDKTVAESKVVKASKKGKPTKAKEVKISKKGIQKKEVKPERKTKAKEQPKSTSSNNTTTFFSRKAKAPKATSQSQPQSSRPLINSLLNSPYLSKNPRSTPPSSQRAAKRVEQPFTTRHISTHKKP